MDSNTDNFKWTDENVRECYIHIRKAFDNPNENNSGKWEGISKEIENFKATHTDRKEESGRDWEVIAYKDIEAITDIPDADIIYSTHGKRWFMATQKNFPIHSVRRLSDGEVFSLGDCVALRFHNPCKIISFEIVGGGTTMYVGGNFVYDNVFQNEDLMDISKISSSKERKPLFHDTLGNAVYEGDEYVYWVLEGSWNIEKGKTNEYYKNHNEKWKVFKNESAAKGYVFAHRPILSYEDVKSIFGGRDFIGTEFFLSHAKELIQSKLKQQ